MRSFGSDEPLYDSPEVSRGNPYRVFGRLVPACPGRLAAVHDIYTASRVDGGKMPDLPSVLAMPSSRLIGIARQAAYTALSENPMASRRLRIGPDARSGGESWVETTLRTVATPQMGRF